jgi:hypothetical protein
VELLPLHTDDVYAHLRRATPPYRTNRWRRVFERLLDEPNGPLAIALSTPLMVWLTTIVYGTGAADPATLLADPLADRASIDEHLLEQVVAVVYGRDWDIDPAPELRNRPWPTGKQAERWLGFLASHLGAHGSADIAWWRLECAVPRRAMGLLAAAVFGSLVALAVAVPLLLSGKVLVGLTYGLVALLAGGAAAGANTGLLHPGREFTPTAVRLRLSRRSLLWLRRHLLEGTIVGALAGLATGLIVMVAVTATTNSANGLRASGTVTGAVFGAVLIARMLDAWLSVPVDTMRAADPRRLLHDDRTSALAKGAVAGLAFGAAFGVARGPLVGITAGLASAISRIMLGDLDQGLNRIGLTAWSRFLLARIWLASRGQMPWRIMAFLGDAHRRQVLRQVGSVYQFRHERLRDRLRLDYEAATTSGRGLPAPVLPRPGRSRAAAPAAARRTRTRPR